MQRTLALAPLGLALLLPFRSAQAGILFDVELSPRGAYASVDGEERGKLEPALGFVTEARVQILAVAAGAGIGWLWDRADPQSIGGAVFAPNVFGELALPLPMIRIGLRAGWQGLRYAEEMNHQAYLGPSLKIGPVAADARFMLGHFGGAMLTIGPAFGFGI